MRRGSLGRGHHPGRPAIIKVGPGPVFLERPSNIEASGRITAIVVKHYSALGGEYRKILQEGGVFGGARAIMGLEIRSPTAQFGDHRHDRRDPDSSGYQKVVLGFI